MSDSKSPKPCPNCAWAIKVAHARKLPMTARWVLTNIAEFVNKETLEWSGYTCITMLADFTGMTREGVRLTLPKIPSDLLEVTRRGRHYTFKMLRSTANVVGSQPSEVGPHRDSEWSPTANDVGSKWPPTTNVVGSEGLTANDVGGATANEVGSQGVTANVVGSQDDLTANAAGTPLPTTLAEVPLSKKVRKSTYPTDTSSREDLDRAEEPEGRGAGKPDIRAEVWADGLRILRILTGQLTSQARPLLGKLLNQANGDCSVVLSALRAAEEQDPYLPIPWITAAIKARQDRSSAASTNGYGEMAL